MSAVLCLGKTNSSTNDPGKSLKGPQLLKGDCLMVKLYVVNESGHEYWREFDSAEEAAAWIACAEVTVLHRIVNGREVE